MNTYTVKTEKTVFGGNTIARINDKTVFIPYSMPDETLDIRIVQQKNDYDNAEIVNIITPSPHRITPKCEYFGVCGGCNMMHIEPDFQRELKKKMILDILEQNKIHLPNDVKIVSGPDYNYRCRFQLNDGGLSAKRSNTIIPIKQCECAETPVNKYLEQTDFTKRPKGRIHLFGSDNVVSENKISVCMDEKSEKSQPQVLKSGSRKIKIKKNNYFSGTVLSPQNTVTINLGGKNLSFDVRGFFQSNLYVFEKVLKLICSDISGKNVLDMYSGCGSISAFLADKFECVTLVEHNRDALVFAEQNLAGRNHVSYGFSGANWVKNCSSFCESFDAIVVDPPRSGMEKEVCDYLCAKKVPVIKSLSCDIATHARDLARLTKSGYEITDFYLLDFYPNTSHIESLAVLRPKDF